MENRNAEPTRLLVIPELESEPALLRVAGYCRVSTLTDAQETSLLNQREHWQQEIEHHSGWTCAGIYWEAGVSGTNAEKRPELQRLMTDCKRKRIDLIVTKSISRFARNTTDALCLVRELNRLGVHILFQKENIDTRTMQGELMLTIFSSIAAEESHSIQTNTQWAIRKRFRDGSFRYSKAPFGYTLSDGNFIIDPERAAVVREIFNSVLAGQGAPLIARTLRERNEPTGTRRRDGSPGVWSAAMVRGIVRNVAYLGDVLMQKTWHDSLYRCRINHGELDQYYCDHHHEAIIDAKTFRLANEAMDQRGKEKGNGPKESEQPQNVSDERSCLSGILYCGQCGSRMKRVTQTLSGRKRYHWVCTRHLADREACPATRVREEDIQNAFITMLNKCYYARHALFDPLIQQLRTQDRETERSSRNALKEKILALQTNQRRLILLLEEGCGDPVELRRQILELEAKLSLT